MIVTGAGRGFGRAIATRFAQDGDSVVMVDRDRERLEEAAAEIGGSCAICHEDVGDPAAAGRIVEFAEHAFGPVDVLINNAGIVRVKPFLEYTAEDWDLTLRVNLSAIFHLSQAAARSMVPRRTGIIVNTASANGHVAEREVCAYNASKAGVVLLTKSMAIELAEHGIRVNCVSPGLTESLGLARDGGVTWDVSLEALGDHVPMGRVGTVDEIAGVFAFLASRDAAFVTGQSIIVDGGQVSEQR